MARYINFAELVVGSSIASGAPGTETLLTLASGESSKLTTAGVKGVLYDGLTYLRPEFDPGREIVYVVDLSGGDTITVLRGMEGTGASAHQNPRLAVLATAHDLESFRPVSVSDFGAVGDGSHDDAPAFQRAADLAETLGTSLYIPPGKYRLTHECRVRVSTRGHSIESTSIIVEPTVNGGGLWIDGASDIQVSDLSMTVRGARACIYAQPNGASAENIVIRNISMTAVGSGGRGINLQAPSHHYDRVTIRDIVCRFDPPSGSNPTGDGILVSAGQFHAHDLTIDNVDVSGFVIGLNVSATTGGWHRVQIGNSTFREALTYGARLYHTGQVKCTTSTFSNNEVGAWLDNSSASESEYETIVSSCHFLDNSVLGVMVEEWRYGQIIGSVFRGNKRGVFFPGAYNSSIIGCSIVENTYWGMNTDKDFVVTGPSGQVYRNNHPNACRGCSIIGSSVTQNGENCIEIKGDEHWRIVGNEIARNGRSAQGPAQSSGYSDLLIDVSGTGTTNLHHDIACNTFGNNSAPNGLHGKVQFGIRQFQGLGSIKVSGNTFWFLENPLDFSGTGSDEAVFSDNYFIQCNAIGIGGAGGVVWQSSNVCAGGLLEESTWDRTQHGDLRTKPGNFAFVALPKSAPDDAQLDKGQMVIWGNESTNTIVIRWRKSNGELMTTTVPAF